MDVRAKHALTTIFGQEGGMDIDNPVFIRTQRLMTKLFHISTEDNQLNIVFEQGFTDGGIELRGCLCGFLAQMIGGYLLFLCEGQSLRLAIVADDDPCLRIESSLGNCMRDRLHTAPTMRGQKSEL